MNFRLYLHCFLVFVAISHAIAKEEISYDEKNNKIVYCAEPQECQTLIIQPGTKEAFYDSKFKIDTFDNKQYLLTTPINNNSANICYELYLIDKGEVSDKKTNILNKGDLCAYRWLSNSVLISRYFSSAKWSEALYQLDKDKYNLILIDECIDCGLTQRTYYDGRKNNQLLISDDTAYENRNPIKAEIIKNKAYLYNIENNNIIKSKAYLINKNSVLLLKKYYDSSSDTWWYYIAYENPKHGTITGWLKDNDINIIK